MDKRHLILLLVICGTVLFIVNKETSNSNQSADLRPIPQSNNYVGTNKYALIDGYTFIGSAVSGDYYFKNESGDLRIITYTTTNYGITNKSRPNKVLFGGVMRKETKNKPTELDQLFVEFSDCKKGYGVLQHQNMSNEKLDEIDWASGVDTIASATAEFLCKESKKWEQQHPYGVEKAELL